MSNFSAKWNENRISLVFFFQKMSGMKSEFVFVLINNYFCKKTVFITNRWRYIFFFSICKPILCVVCFLFQYKSVFFIKIIFEYTNIWLKWIVLSENWEYFMTIYLFFVTNSIFMYKNLVVLQLQKINWISDYFQNFSRNLNAIKVFFSFFFIWNAAGEKWRIEVLDHFKSF